MDLINLIIALIAAVITYIVLDYVTVNLIAGLAAVLVFLVVAFGGGARTFR